MNKISRLVKITRAIHSAKNSIFASKDLLELLKDPEMRKKLEEKQKQEELESKKQKSEKKSTESKSSKPKSKDDMTPEESSEHEEKHLERWLSKQAFQRGLLILKEHENAQDIAYLNRIMDEIEGQPLPKQDEPYADKIRFGISFVKSLRGGTSKIANSTKFIKDFSQEELKEMKESLDQQEKEEVEKKLKFKEEYGIDLPEGKTWERTLPDGSKVYVLSQKQLSTLVSVYMDFKKRIQKQKERLKILQEKAKKLLKSPTSQELDIDLKDEDLDFFK